MKKIKILFIFSIFVFSSFSTIAISTDNEKIHIISDKIIISKPLFTINDNYIIININESDCFLYTPGKPLLPIITKFYTFPLGTTIFNADVNCEYKEYFLSKKIQPCPTPLIISKGFSSQLNKVNPDETVYNSKTLYPTEKYVVSQGAGLKDEGHFLFINIQILPRYSPLLDLLLIPIEIKITIEYEVPEESLFTADDFDMVIIAPDQFSSTLNPLIDHKNSYGIQTILKTTKEIYDEYNGRDDAEKIKYFIKDAIESYGIKYVMLVGDVNTVPMRKCKIKVITGVINWHEILSDLYYADIYDSYGNFSSWDTNHNEKYCESSYDFSSGSLEFSDFEIIDIVDLYPDIGIGRLPCNTIDECQSVIDKIIHYESSYDKNWYNNMILMGGDTTPDYESALDGEWLHEKYICPAMSKYMFQITKLYTSLNTFQPDIITNEINSGAGFVSYAGHGNIESIGTYPPLGNSTISYSIQDFDELTNGYKLPVFFLDACLTGKIDYDIFDKIMIPLTALFPNKVMHFFKYITDAIETQKHFPCFAGSLLLKQSGGSIAVIAATQPGLVGFVINNGEIIDILFGSSNLNRFFFESYEPGIILSDMFVESQNLYINTIRSPDSYIVDFVTVTEFNLFGDPSLKMGGYQ